MKTAIPVKQMCLHPRDDAFKCRVYTLNLGGTAGYSRPMYGASLFFTP